MNRGRSWKGWCNAATLLASLALLQPGIDPIFLTLLTSVHGVRPADHGWIVGASQAGMAAGSLVCWFFGPRLHRHMPPIVALVALTMSAATVCTRTFILLLLLRGGYGLAMGLIYTQAMSRAAARHPHGSYGAVFLFQLLLSLLTALALPRIVDSTAPMFALAALMLAPLCAALLAMWEAMNDGISPPYTTPLFCSLQAAAEPGPDIRAWVLVIATFCFICATMMIWSFTGAIAIEAGISGDDIGNAVAIGSIAGAISAFAVMREKILLPPVITGLLSSMCLLTPIAAASTGRSDLFNLSILLLNIGSTVIIIRGSGLASALGGSLPFRRIVACMHSLGMIAGPVGGSLAVLLLGQNGLPIIASTMLLTGCLLLFLSGRHQTNCAPSVEHTCHQLSFIEEGTEAEARPSILT